jgi:hypothetical protein
MGGVGRMHASKVLEEGILKPLEPRRVESDDQEKE